MDNITKTRTIPAVFNEIIGKQIADIYGLICPEVCAECQTDGTYNITSLNLNITGTFMMPCYHKDIASLYDVWNYLEDKSLLRPELINDFIKMYTMDVIFGNPDRSPDN